MFSTKDRHEITDVLAFYAHTYDMSDIDGFCELFKPDGVVIYYHAGKFSSETPQSERPGILKKRFKAFREKGIAQTRHFITNIVLEPRNDGTVYARSWFQVAHQYHGEPAPRLVHTGEYRDIFEQTPSGWKIARHEIHMDHA